MIYYTLNECAILKYLFNSLLYKKLTFFFKLVLPEMLRPLWMKNGMILPFKDWHFSGVKSKTFMILWQVKNIALQNVVQLHNWSPYLILGVPGTVIIGYYFKDRIYMVKMSKPFLRKSISGESDNRTKILRKESSTVSTDN